MTATAEPHPQHVIPRRQSQTEARINTKINPCPGQESIAATHGQEPIHVRTPQSPAAPAKPVGGPAHHAPSGLKPSSPTPPRHHATTPPRHHATTPPRRQGHAIPSARTPKPPSGRGCPSALRMIKRGDRGHTASWARRSEPVPEADRARDGAAPRMIKRGGWGPPAGTGSG
jgi:hypothetical protein